MHLAQRPPKTTASSVLQEDNVKQRKPMADSLGSSSVVISSSTQSGSLASHVPTTIAVGGSGGGGGLSSASSLYLYTFLATLVLLLLISAGVILRSLSLRVQTRRRIEEAIRNGTYVPPESSPFQNANASRPISYDTRLKGRDYEGQELDWRKMQPMAASFVAPQGWTSTSFESNEKTRPPSKLARLRDGASRLLRALYIQDVIDEINMRDLHSQFAHRSANSQQPLPTQAELAAAVFENETGSVSNQDDHRKQDDMIKRTEIGEHILVRFAVLIVMPDPVHPTYEQCAKRVDGKCSTFDAGHNGPSRASEEGAQDELPYLEFGVAEMPFSS